MRDQASSGCMEKVVTAVVSSVITAALLWLAAHVYHVGILGMLGGVGKRDVQQIANASIEEKLGISDIQAGRAAIGSGLNIHEFEVSFVRPFLSVPLVVATAAGGSTDERDTFSVTTFEITPSGFKGYVTRIGFLPWGQNLHVDWLAVEVRKPVHSHVKAQDGLPF